MYDQINGIPKAVIDVLAPLRKKYDFIYLENSEALFYELRAAGNNSAVDFISDANGLFDREKFEQVVITIMHELKKGRIS